MYMCVYFIKDLLRCCMLLRIKHCTVPRMQFTFIVKSKIAVCQIRDGTLFACLLVINNCILYASMFLVSADEQD